MAATITLNGQEQTLQQPTPLVNLLAAQGIGASQQGIAVAINGRVVRRASWHQAVVQPGDRLEVIQAQQGG